MIVKPVSGAAGCRSKTEPICGRGYASWSDGRNSILALKLI